MRSVVVLILSSLFTLAQAGEYELPPTVSANKLFPGVALKGTHYQIKVEVPTDGFLTRAVIESGFGTFEAVGPGMLATRLNEIEALAKLQTFEESDEFQRGAKESAQEKKESLKQAAANPKETVEGIGEGVGRFFKRTYRTAQTGMQKAGDVMQDKAPGASDQIGPGAALPGKAQAQVAGDTESKYAKLAKASGEVAVNILGFDDARRRLAKRLGVDPYTTNGVLDAKLDEVTKAIFLGDLGVDVATALIPGGVLVNRSTMVTDWVWDTPPGDLRVKIEDTLSGIGIADKDIDRLLRHYLYPLSYQAALTAALQSLQGVAGRPGIMPLALSVTTVDQARFVVNNLRMLAQYHQTVRPLKGIKVLGSIAGITKDEVTVVAVPVDYLSWTLELDQYSSREPAAGKKREVHIAGTMTDQARSQLKARGWEISENSGLFVQASSKSNSEKK